MLRNVTRFGRPDRHEERCDIVMSRSAGVLAAIYLLVMHTSAVAQGCPTGLAGLPNCVPPDQSSPGNTAAGGGGVPALWESRWGAIAVDGPHSKMGVSQGQRSKRAAKRGAEAECQAQGGVACKIEIVYTNQCAVLVWGLHKYVAARGPTIESAANEGMRVCRPADSDCVVFYSACSLPERVQ